MGAVRLIRVIRVDEAGEAEGPMSESGVREAVRVGHAQEVRTLARDARPDSRTELPNRGIRANATRGPARIGAAKLIDEALTEARCSTADLAIALNISETLARQIRSGERPVELGDACIIARRLPQAGPGIRRRILELFFEEKGGPR